MNSSNNKSGKQSHVPLIISGIILAGLAVGYFAIPAVNSFFKEAYNTLTSGNEDKISTWVNHLGFWGPLFIILFMTLQMFLIVIPSPLLIVVSVLAYGPWWGTFISVVAVALASTVGYFIGKYLGITVIDRLIGHRKEQKIEFYVSRYGVWAVIITRLAPVLSNDAISFVGGILRMNYLKFIGATMAGIIPLTVLIAYFGENNQRLKNGLIWTSVVSLLFLIIYIIYDRKKNPAGKTESGQKT